MSFFDYVKRLEEEKKKPKRKVKKEKKVIPSTVEKKETIPEPRISTVEKKEVIQVKPEVSTVETPTSRLDIEHMRLGDLFQVFIEKGLKEGIFMIIAYADISTRGRGIRPNEITLVLPLERDTVRNILRELEREGRIAKDRNNYYHLTFESLRALGKEHLWENIRKSKEGVIRF